MKIQWNQVAGVDVHKDILVITVLSGAPDEEPKAQTWTCETFTEDLRECGHKLLSLGVTEVAMESTGIYWKPVYNVWHAMGLRITLGNAGHMKNVPGRKTDVNDSHWIAELHRNGLIRGSFIPEREFQELRALNRHRANLVEDISRVKNRIQKVLEDGNIKLGSVLSDVFGIGGMQILNAISGGETDPGVLAERLTTQIRNKRKLKKSLQNCLRGTDLFLMKQLMRQYRDLSERLVETENALNQRMSKYRDLKQRLIEIPGVDEVTANGIIAEATTHMEMFKDDRTFAAWAGVAPGNNESAGKKKDLELGTATQPCGEC